MLEYITSGESHGRYLIALLHGMPSGLTVDERLINHELHRRQCGYGRGGRMKIEKDTIVVTSGVYKGRTTGAPLGLMIKNTDHSIDEMPEHFRPRPGHADLGGSLKYDTGIREVLERSSARETALRVAIGAVCKSLLNEFGVGIVSHVTTIGGISVGNVKLLAKEIQRKAKKSRLNCVSPTAERKMIALIDKMKVKGDTLGGNIEVIATGVPVGLGSHTHYTRKLDGRLARGLMSLQAIKAVQIGLGEKCAELPGSRIHDEIFYSSSRGYYRKSNNAGGIEGGMSNGSDIRLEITMKPISTLKKPLRSVDMRTHRTTSAVFERSDVCAVPACSVVAESIVAYELTDAFLEKFGGDSVRELKRNYTGYIKQIRNR